MKFRIFYIFIFLVLVGACDTNNWEEYNIEKTGISVEFPEGAKITTKKKEMSLAYYSNVWASLDSGVLYRVAVIDYAENGNELEIDRAMEETYSTKECSNPNYPDYTFKLEHKEIITIAGKKAYAITCKSDNSEIGNIYFFAKGSMQVTLSISAPNGQSTNLDYFLSNIKFDSTGN